MPPLRVFAGTDIGKEHHTNEDSFAVQPVGDDVLLLVCDGMGGMGRGDEASSFAVDTILDSTDWPDGDTPTDVLRHAIGSADIAVRAALCNGPGRPGCTAVAFWVREDSAWLAWVGDSRGYLVRNSEIVARTRDHKLVEELVAAGDLTPEEAKNSPMSSVLTRALGGRKPGPTAVEVSDFGKELKLQPGDRLLLCSDGLVDLVSDEEVIAGLDQHAEEAAVKHFIDLALERGGHDNITVIVADVVDEAPPVEASRSKRTEISTNALERAARALSGPAAETPIPSQRAIDNDARPPLQVAPVPRDEPEGDDNAVLMASIVIAVGLAVASWGIVQMLRG